MSPISRARAATSPACPSWPGSCAPSPPGRSSRSASPVELADTIVDTLHPLGALVLIEAEHLCMSMRGVRSPGAKTVTSAVRGIVESNDATRAEVMALINAPR